MKTIKIGRGLSNDININDAMVSETHCQITKDDSGNYHLTDLNSTNGTFINGTQSDGEVLLSKSDVVRIGITTLPWQTYFEDAIVGTATGKPANVEHSAPIEDKPNNFLVWAILSTVICCPPFGIPSIVNAAKVDKLWAEGNYDGAKRAAKQARTWFKWAIIAGIIGSIIYGFYYYFVIIAAGLGGFM